MITVPKPRFAKTNVPDGESLEDYRDAIYFVQTHVLEDAIDRVSRRNRDSVVGLYDIVHFIWSIRMWARTPRYPTHFLGFFPCCHNGN